MNTSLIFRFICLLSWLMMYRVVLSAVGDPISPVSQGVLADQQVINCVVLDV